jgi:hypothetical protein
MHTGGGGRGDKNSPPPRQMFEKLVIKLVNKNAMKPKIGYLLAVFSRSLDPAPRDFGKN